MQRSYWRFFWMFLGGIGIHLLMGLVETTMEKNHSGWIDFFFTLFITFLVWEGNLWIDYWANKKFPWLEKPVQRIAVQFPLGMGYAAFVIYFLMHGYNRYICLLPTEAQDKFFGASLLIGLFVSAIILTAEIGSQFFRQWKNSLVEVEKYKAESYSAQLQNLKNQINPHFLFNNLSVLSSLVYKDQEKAVDFINQLSKVYRYFLDSNSKELVSLESEVKFIESYIYLLKIRFDSNIHFEMDIAAADLNFMLPPMALQMLVENTIKHNEVSTGQPLQVKIFSSGQSLHVRNNFQPRRSVEAGSQTGLKNIKERYRYFTEREVLVSNKDGFFEVQIPLLSVV